MEYSLHDNAQSCNSDSDHHTPHSDNERIKDPEITEGLLCEPSKYTTTDPTIDLPIFSNKVKILNSIRNNFVTIVVGETGSGKTTQIPQFVIDDEQLKTILKPKDNQVRICVTQPRRVAAASMARRVAYERHVILGDEVGYAVRFDDHSSSKTIIRYVTDGVALREVLETGGFEHYNVFMIDEAHERSLNTDILFALIKKAFVLDSSKLPNFRVIISSATLDAQRFSSFFYDAPIVTVPGRLFHVEVIYNPCNHPETPSTQDIRKRKKNTSLIPSSVLLLDSAVNAALNIHLMAIGPEDLGHILVFLTGRAECEAACSLAMNRLEEIVKSQREVGDAVIMPLYGALSSEDQAIVFEPVPEGCRKIIFATNVAETSLTVDGIEFVVDCGFVKQKVCNPQTGMESLVAVKIAKSQAIQRAGRAGRVKKGRCYRLYSEDEFDEFPDSPELEIERSNLYSVVLQLKSLGLNDVMNIQFIDPPTKESILMALKQLFLLGALDCHGDLTELGRRMVSLPLDPMYARCLIAGWKFNVAEDVAAIVAMLSTENVWARPFKSKNDKDHNSMSEKAERRYRNFYHEAGDHLTLLNLFRAFESVPYSRRREWCRENFVLMRSLSQASDIYQQLLGLLSSHRRNLKRADAPWEDTSDSGGRWKRDRHRKVVDRKNRSLRKDHQNDPKSRSQSRRSRSQSRRSRSQSRRSRSQSRRSRSQSRRSRSQSRRSRSQSRRSSDDKRQRKRGTSVEWGSNHRQRRSKLESDENKDERILRSLCEGCFINSAKITSAALNRSVWDLEESENDEEAVMKQVWVSLKDGILMKCNRFSSLAVGQDLRKSKVNEDIPEFVIFNEVTSTSGYRQSVGYVGTMKVLSRVQKEWISHLISRFNEVDLRSLTKTHSNSECPNSHPIDVPLNSAPFKIQVIDDPIGTSASTEGSASRQEQSKIGEARQRYLERRRTAKC